MAEQRSPLAITLSVWRAIFLREALDRLFDMRAAWLWLLMEPVLHISFVTFIWTVVRLRTIGGIDVRDLDNRRHAGLFSVPAYRHANHACGRQQQAAVCLPAGPAL